MKEKKPVLVAPSLLSADFSRIEEAVKIIASTGGDWIHLDIMDGMFVPNITFGPKMVEDIRPITHLPLDVHLMIEKPENHIDSFIDAGADFLTFHMETTVHAHRLIQRIKKRGIKAGISIVPSTPVAAIEEIIPDLDLILIMAVNPGFGGQKLIPKCVDKIQLLDVLRSDHGFSYLIAVDGGINEHTVGSVKGAGVDVLITGSSFFESNSPQEYVLSLKGE